MGSTIILLLYTGEYYVKVNMVYTIFSVSLTIQLLINFIYKLTVCMGQFSRFQDEIRQGLSILIKIYTTGDSAWYFFLSDNILLRLEGTAWSLFMMLPLSGSLLSIINQPNVIWRWFCRTFVFILERTFLKVFICYMFYQ